MRSVAPLLLVALSTVVSGQTESWPRHAIDDSLRGADGVRLADFNGDGLLDVVSGWEESGRVRLYLNPGPKRAREPWPAVTVGREPSPEDAVPADVDADGLLDVVSCHEGKSRKLLVHFQSVAETDEDDGLLRESRWRTDEFRQLAGQWWMFAAPLNLASHPGSLVAGSKGRDATITLLIPPDGSREDLTRWRAIRLRRAGWIMSLRIWDMDGDGDDDVVYSDRKGTRRGVGWLEQPRDPDAVWRDHPIGGQACEVMFLDLVADDLRERGPRILVSTRNSRWLDCRPSGTGWEIVEHANPAGITNGKAIARLSPNAWIMTANTVTANVERLPGVWLKRGENAWQPICSDEGSKFDRIELVDLNGDGRLDIMTCEERRNRGVIWYENPGH